MRKALIIRYPAYGDAIHMSHLPRLLKDEGYGLVDVETNFKGYQILSLNPFIDNIKAINPVALFEDTPINMFKHWQIMAEKYNLTINLINTLESGCLAMENEESYYMSSGARRQRYGGKNFYDVTTEFAGFPHLVGKYTGEVYYEPAEEEIVIQWIRKFKGKFKVLINLSGTGPHKRFVQVKEVARNILQKYPDAHIITTGGPDCKELDFKYKNMTSIVGTFPFRQALLVAKHMNCAIGMESGIMVGCSMWEVPTVQLMTAASPVSHGKYNPNELALQSPAYCSPCYKGPYQYRGCPHKDGSPLCVYFNVDDIMEKVQVAYGKYKTSTS